MSRLLRLSRCPYCHKKISYLGSMFLKTKGEYNCKSCKCISNVVISRAAYAIASGICVLALLIVVIYSLAGDHGNILGIILVFAPFLIFYLIVPFLVRLAPCKDRSAVDKLIDSSITSVPGKTAYKSIQNQPKLKPVKLDVEDDFSAKFMKAKKSVQVEHSEEKSEISAEPEDISNTKIAIDLKRENIYTDDL